MLTVVFPWLQVGGSGDAKSPPGQTGPVNVQIRGIPAGGIKEVQKHVRATCPNFTVRFIPRDIGKKKCMI